MVTVLEGPRLLLSHGHGAVGGSIEPRRPPPPTDQWSSRFIGHAAFLFSRRHHVLTDPVYSRRASPSRSRTPSGSGAGRPFDDLPISLVLLSHNHYVTAISQPCSDSTALSSNVRDTSATAGAPVAGIRQ